MDQTKILNKYNFKTHLELEDWCFAFEEDWLVDDDIDEVLYTDGDDGLAKIRLSECWGEDGLSIELVECKYCDFHIDSLKKIHRLLKSAV